MEKRILLLFAIIMAVSTFYAQTPPTIPTTSLSGQAREVHRVVETKPAFPGCSNTRGSIEHRNCSEENMLKFIYRNLEYPAIALKNGVEGTVFLRFIIEEDSSLTNFEIVRDIGAGCGTNALKVAMQMPKWEPGLQRGKPVAVEYNLPIRFSLDEHKKREKEKKKAARKN
jgi:protein TonB